LRAYADEVEFEAQRLSNQRFDDAACDLPSLLSRSEYDGASRKEWSCDGNDRTLNITRDGARETTKAGRRLV
jgi:hypothetical protein